MSLVDAIESAHEDDGSYLIVRTRSSYHEIITCDDGTYLVNFREVYTIRDVLNIFSGLDIISIERRNIHRD
jgi:hypothetical protein